MILTLDVDLGQLYLHILTVVELNQDCLIALIALTILGPPIQEMPE
jgi:hypothetical protein